MILSDTPAKKKQINAVGRARAWRGNMRHVRKAIEEADAAYPLSAIQWYNLGVVHGAEKIYAIKHQMKKGGKDEV